MLKYENVAQVGERIRAYDFDGRVDCYIEGVVERTSDEQGFMAFVVKADVDGWRGERQLEGNRVGLTFFVPMESIFDWEDRIVKC